MGSTILLRPMHFLRLKKIPLTTEQLKPKLCLVKFQLATEFNKCGCYQQCLINFVMCALVIIAFSLGIFP